jgi:hypothetical protein
MNQMDATHGVEDESEGRGNADVLDAVGLDAQLAELIEFVFTCEGAWRREARLDAVVRYGRRS